MLRRLPVVFLLAALATPALYPAPASAQQPAKAYLFGEKRFRHACRPPLKFAAGACVRRCPAGYETQGRYCRVKSSNFD